MEEYSSLSSKDKGDIQAKSFDLEEAEFKS